MAEAALKVIEWLDRAGLTIKQPMRMVKLIQPRCATCKPTGPGWWDRCEHKPYHSMQAVEDPNGKMVFNKETGTYTEDVNASQVIRSYRLIPNVIQIPLSIRVGNGREVDKAMANGCKYPEEVKPLLPDGSEDPDHDGYAPMCEFENCYAPNPQVVTKHSMLEKNREVSPQQHIARYCTKRHAKYARLKDSEKTRYVAEINESTAAAAREQLDSIVL